MIPKALARIAVQRQTAASRSTRPAIRLQHAVGGSPRVISIRSSKPTHKFNWTESLGQVGSPLDGLPPEFGFGKLMISLPSTIAVGSGTG